MKKTYEFRVKHLVIMTEPYASHDASKIEPM